jgi:hypothetical protein
MSACATKELKQPDSAATSMVATSKTSSQLTQAVTTPLSDLNLVRDEIPLALQAAVKAPYAVPAVKNCDGYASEITALDAALGADLDTPASANNPSLIERGTSAASDAAVGSVRGAVEGAIPFRGWIRRLSGAERYSKEVAAAIAAGTIRRAFIKGLGQAAGCVAPAAPHN